MNLEQFQSHNYSYQDLADEIKPLVMHKCKAEDIDFADMKIIKFNRKEFHVLVLTCGYKLWKFEFEMLNPERWNVHVIQSSAKVLHIYELLNSKATTNQKALKEECLDFFESAKCFIEH